MLSEVMQRLFRRGPCTDIVECEFCGGWLAGEEEWFDHMTADDPELGCVIVRDYEEAKRIWKSKPVDARRPVPAQSAGGD